MGQISPMVHIGLEITTSNHEPSPTYSNQAFISLQTSDCLVSWHVNKEAQRTTSATCLPSWTPTSLLQPSSTSSPKSWSDETNESPTAIFFLPFFFFLHFGLCFIIFFCSFCWDMFSLFYSERCLKDLEVIQDGVRGSCGWSGDSDNVARAGGGRWFLPQGNCGSLSGEAVC